MLGRPPQLAIDVALAVNSRRYRLQSSILGLFDYIFETLYSSAKSSQSVVLISLPIKNPDTLIFLLAMPSRFIFYQPIGVFKFQI